MSETKNEKFKRLAKLRGERVLRDLRLLSNLSNRNNYEYSEADIKAIFSAVEEELKVTRAMFIRQNRRDINL